MRTISILCCVICGLLINTSHADEWVMPQPTVYVSENSHYTCLVIPGSETSPCQASVYRENEPNPSAKLNKIESWTDLKSVQMQPGESWEDYRKRNLDQWQSDPVRQLLWSVKLENGAAPVEVFVSDNGKYVVTLDNWHRVGYGDEVAAFYQADGLIKKYDLETIIPLAEKTGVNPIPNNTEDGSFINVLPQSYYGLFSHSVSSRWWRENGVELLTILDGKDVFGVWLSWKKDWIIWDVQTGQIIADHSRFVGQFNELARRRVLKNLDTEEKLNNACHFLAYNKNPEDRKLIEEMLTDKHFGTGTSSRDRVLVNLLSKSRLRCTADMALAIWDGKLNDFTDEWGYDYHYLGSVKGKLLLPEVPQKDHSVYIYLVPKTIPENEWTARTYPQSLQITFDPYALPDTKEIPFEIAGITPGSYSIKAIYQKSMKDRNFSSLNDIYAAQQGDYINSDTITLEIQPGKIVQKDIICKQKIE